MEWSANIFLQQKVAHFHGYLRVFPSGPTRCLLFGRRGLQKQPVRGATSHAIRRALSVPARPRETRNECAGRRRARSPPSARRQVALGVNNARRTVRPTRRQRLLCTTVSRRREDSMATNPAALTIPSTRRVSQLAIANDRAVMQVTDNIFGASPAAAPSAFEAWPLLQSSCGHPD